MARGIKEVLQGWLLCVGGFVCLANVPDLVSRLMIFKLEQTFVLFSNNVYFCLPEL